ncbi:MAG: hypothetical protein ACRDEA_02005 [Microcystaceae cyanobacterium]
MKFIAALLPIIFLLPVTMPAKAEEVITAKCVGISVASVETTSVASDSSTTYLACFIPNTNEVSVITPDGVAHALSPYDSEIVGHMIDTNFSKFVDTLDTVTEDRD